jgi:hypothetical protein
VTGTPVGLRTPSVVAQPLNQTAAAARLVRKKRREDFMLVEEGKEIGRPSLGSGAVAGGGFGVQRPNKPLAPLMAVASAP